ncbi:MAG: hypothetical protein RIC19_01380 [Phaeodactylibacter sp.]|uniref:hypothetical protein n=1 Tax=Phaeodactylibacter sp. TaxID=1940289 RepID=UPI0032ECB184
MISQYRMKFDLVGQSVLLALALIVVLGEWWLWALTVVAGLALWQTGSAFHLLAAYAYRDRKPYLWVLGSLLILLPFKFWLAGYWSLVLLGLAAFTYFLITLRDTIVVLRRPRSFWDI